MHEEWHGKYGKVITYDGIISVRLMLSFPALTYPAYLTGLEQLPNLSILDKRALLHILVAEPYKFPKPSLDRRFLASFLGNGLSVPKSYRTDKLNQSFLKVSWSRKAPIMPGNERSWYATDC